MDINKKQKDVSEIFNKMKVCTKIWPRLGSLFKHEPKPSFIRQNRTRN